MRTRMRIPNANKINYTSVCDAMEVNFQNQLIIQHQQGREGGGGGCRRYNVAIAQHSSIPVKPVLCTNLRTESGGKGGAMHILYPRSISIIYDSRTSLIGLACR